MLEIDYSLIRLSEADQQMVRDEVMRRVNAGDIPPPDRSVNGRLALISPDPVQTIHQIPDELRPRLRRIMVQAQEGSTHLSAERLYEHIVESDERLYLIVIELHSEFRSFSSFLDYLPKLRTEYPELAVFLSGTLPDLRSRLQQVLSEGGATLVLEFDGGERIVEVSSAEKFSNLVSTREQIVSYSTPFFTEIRLKLQEGSKPIPFNLLTLRKLHPVFGFGEAEEVEVGKGRKERKIIVDLPVQLIHDFRFRQDRGLDFLGVVLNGSTVESRYFGDEKLEFRWVPMKAVDAFLRRSPAGNKERVDMKGIARLRVNTLTGEVSFLPESAGEKIAVEQAGRISFRKSLSPATRKEWGRHDQEPEQAEEEQLVHFDRYIQPSTSSAQFDPMQEAVRDHFYLKLIGESVEHARKQEVYAQRLVVSAVGPLAGQTLKLLRRFGLEQLIDPESFYYLCDTPEEVPYYRNTPNRYEEHFGGLVETIREVAVGQPSDRVRIADVAYNMPVSTEWVDTGLASLEGASNPELEAVYREMQLLQDFIAHEFRRNFDIQQEDVTFFGKMQTCRDAGLLAKWLGEFKRGAYGQPMPENAYPDVLFFATEEDKAENDKRYYFPSLSCTDILQKPENKGIFREFNYEFSVFLEEQMAVAVHFAREDGNLHPGLEEFSAYFERKIKETKEEEEELRAMLAAIDDENSPIYAQMLEQEEKAYQDRYHQFQQDRERVANELVETTGRVQEVLDEVKGRLDRGEATEEEFFRDVPDHPELLEQRILGAATRTQARLNEQLVDSFTGLLEAIGDWREQLAQFMLALRRYLHYQQQWQVAHETAEVIALREQWQTQLRGRMEQIRRMKAIDREQHSRRVGTQLRNYQGELTQITNRLAEQAQKNQRAAHTLNSYVQSAEGRLESLQELAPGDAPDKVVSQARSLRKLLMNIASNAGTLSGRLQELQESLEQMRVRKLRHVQQLFQLRAEMAAVRAVEEHQEPVLPKVKTPGGKEPTAQDVERLNRAWRSQEAAMGEARGELTAKDQSVQEALQSVRSQALEYTRFGEKHEELLKLISRKARLRESSTSLAERQTIMEDELQDLPQRVREKFMPARKQLLVEVFLPQQEHKAVQFDRANRFIAELIGLAQEPLKEKYLDHAIYRRFYSGQFMSGGMYAGDMDSRMHFPTRNVAPAARLLVRALTHNFQLQKTPGLQRIQLPTLSSQEPEQILATIRNLAAVPGRGQFDYLILPPTLDLKAGLNLLHQKDEIYEGVPRLVLIFVSKWDPNLLRQNAELRESYFKALKHNIVLNIDGYVVVDNPRSIGMRLLQETLGCAIDMPSVEEPPAAVSAAE